MWDAGQAMTAFPAQQDEVVQVVVPEGLYLSEKDLAETEGASIRVIITLAKTLAKKAVNYIKENGKDLLIGSYVGYKLSEHVFEPAEKRLSQVWEHTRKKLVKTWQRAKTKLHDVIEGRRKHIIMPPHCFCDEH